MKNYLDWFDQDGFWTNNAWSIAENQWVGSGKLELFDFQRRILGHCFTFDKNDTLPYSTVIYSTIKKSGKSKVAASVATWVAETFQEGSEIFICANDMEQAQNIVFKDIQYHVRKAQICEAMKKTIDYPNGNSIQALAQHYASASGSRHVLSVWDELWAYNLASALLMWAEMTPPPTVPNAFRFIGTYAGYENQNGPLLELYNAAWREGEPVPELADIVNTAGDPICRRKGKIFVMWDDVPRMPWQTDEYYEDQLTTLRPEDFLRQHRNQWVSGTETFIPIEHWDQCITLGGQLVYKTEDPMRVQPISVGVDIGTKHDCSAVVGVGYNTITHRPFLAFHKIWTPTAAEPLDIENTVERYLLEMWKTLNVTDISFDPVQFHRSAMTLKKKGVPVMEFPQTDSNMMGATQILYDVIRNHGIDLYPDDELREHIRHSPVRYSPRGMRIRKEKNAKYKIDAAVAMAMATYMAVRGGGRSQTAPMIFENPFSDGSSMRVRSFRSQVEMKLPEPLRSNDYE